MMNDKMNEKTLNNLVEWVRCALLKDQESCVRCPVRVRCDECEDESGSILCIQDHAGQFKDALIEEMR